MNVMKMKLLAAALAFVLAAPAVVTPAMAQHRHGWHNNQHRHGWNNHDRWDRRWNRGWNRGWYRNSWGPAIGFGLGLGAGAAAGAYASGADQRNDAYCSQRFRSYDPASGTYLGYDGQRHPCR